MLALSISDVRGFMVKLLKEEVFDEFQLRNVVINTFARFEIYGTKEDGYASWSEIRPHIFGIIKGDKLPKTIKNAKPRPIARFSFFFAWASS